MRTTSPLQLVIAGATGNVGSALCRTLQQLQPHGVTMRLLANSRRTWSAGETPGAATDWDATLNALNGDVLTGDRLLFVDCTASHGVASLYGRLLENRVGIVTANKIAGSGPAGQWRTLRTLADRSAVPLLYETTAGAALPILRTARQLAATGDPLLSLDAVLSGTISYLLGRVQDGAPFSAAVAEAQANGFTEPDPLVDLSGGDVAAKLVIVLREFGIDLERDAIDVEPLATSAAEVRANDASWRERVSNAAARGKRLVYVASYRDGRATARVREIDRDQPLARLRGAENIVIFRTPRYDTVPLTIAGPGAGPEVTAAGLLAEVLEVARSGIR